MYRKTCWLISKILCQLPRSTSLLTLDSMTWPNLPVTASSAGKQGACFLVDLAEGQAVLKETWDMRKRVVVQQSRSRWQNPSRTYSCNLICCLQHPSASFSSSFWIFNLGFQFHPQSIIQCTTKLVPLPQLCHGRHRWENCNNPGA